MSFLFLDIDRKPCSQSRVRQVDLPAALRRQKQIGRACRRARLPSPTRSPLLACSRMRGRSPSRTETAAPAAWKPSRRSEAVVRQRIRKQRLQRILVAVAPARRRLIRFIAREVKSRCEEILPSSGQIARKPSSSASKPCAAGLPLFSCPSGVADELRVDGRVHRASVQLAAECRDRLMLVQAYFLINWSTRLRASRALDSD